MMQHASIPYKTKGISAYNFFCKKMCNFGFQTKKKEQFLIHEK